jgi:hypothetical protein
LKYSPELVARIRAACLFMDVKVVALGVNVPPSYVQDIHHGKRRTEVEPDNAVIEALKRILREGTAA